MSCCGKRRQEWMQSAADASGITPNPSTTNTGQEAQVKVFKFTGTGSLSITGAFTGLTYYFPFPGATVDVDYHDAFALVAEPGLTLVPRSTHAS